MANQNFRVKKGLEVGLGATFLYVDDTGVGINSAIPQYNLDVDGVANITNGLQVGAPTTAIAGVASTTFQVKGDSFFDGNITVTGDLLFDDAVIDDLIVTGIATIRELDFAVGIGSTLTITDNLSVTGLTTLSNTIVEGVLGVSSSVGIAKTLIVGGDVVVGGGITFEGNVDIDINVNVEGNINVGGISSLNELSFNVGIGSTLTVDDLIVNDEISVNGAGIATIGGDPLFNTLTVLGVSTFGGIDTTGISTFYHNLEVDGDLSVGGNIELLDLDAGNITVGGTIFTNGLEFNVGIGTTLTVGFLSVTNDIQINGSGVATIGGDPEFNTLTVLGISTFGGLNTTGVSTFYQNAEVTGDLKVGGNIELSDLDAGNITIGGTMTSNGLIFNSGVGTSLVITGISSLNIITGIGSELQYLPAGSISTSVGIGSSVPPTLRPTGEPIQQGDLWFDSTSLRQFTYYVSAGSTEGIWVDSNPPPIQPDLDFAGDSGPQSSIDIASDVFNILGISSEIITRVPSVGTGQTIFIGLTTDVSIKGNLDVAEAVRSENSLTTGIATVGFLSATNAFIDSISIGDITVDDITVENIGINTLSFNVGVGSTLSVTDLSVDGDVDINGAGIATVGGAVSFTELFVSGITTLGLTTITQSLYVNGNLDVGGDLSFDEATLRNLNVTGISTLQAFSFTDGSGDNLTLSNDVSVGGTFGVTGNVFLEDNLNVGGVSTFVGFSTFSDDIFVRGDINVGGDLGVDEVTARNVTASGQLISQSTFTYTVGSGTTFSVSSQLNVTGQAGIETLTVNDALSVPGISSFTGEIGFQTATGYELNVDRLIVPPSGFVDLPGIPVVGGAGSFSTLYVSGIASFIGFTTITGDVAVSGAMTVGSLTAGEINFSGGTGIGSDSISTQDLDVSGLSNLTDLNVSGFSTFVGFATFTDIWVGGAATIGVLTATNAVMENLTITGNLSGTEGGAIIIDGDGSISGIVTIGENSITLDGRAGREYIELGTGSGVRIAGLNTFTSDPSNVTVDEGRFNNNITVSGISSTSTFAGDVSIEGQLTVDGDIDLGGEVVGVTTFASINVSGIATVGFLTATNASIAGIITATDFNALSDRRLKENITQISDPLEKVNRLNGVHYNFVNSGKKSMGVIAQEVEAVFPELIAGTYPKSVNYNGLTGLLIEAVKELKLQNEDLKMRLEKLEG